MALAAAISAPASRICYVDNDPTVLAHARALLTIHPAGEIMGAVPAGSYLVISHPARDIAPAEVAEEVAGRFNERLGGVQSRGRTHEEVAAFFAGLDLVPPGVVPTPRWRPAPGGQVPDSDPAYAAVARKS